MHSYNHKLKILQQQSENLSIPTLEVFEMINLKEVLYLEAENTYTTFFLSDGKKIVATKNIGHYEEELYNDPAIIIIKENQESISLESLLAIFNSKLATFYHFNSSPKATKGAFPKILVYDINNFPLPKVIDKIIEEKLKLLVEKIHFQKQTGSDTKLEENQIDQLVYQLYDLTEEEIKIIENA